MIILNDKKLKNMIHIKFILLKCDTKFSGNYNIKFRRYNTNTNKNTFDIVDLEINMLENHETNLNFIKSNPDTVKQLLKEIIYVNRSTKKYANYLKLYNLTLTADNILLASFCFKDKLEKLCK